MTSNPPILSVILAMDTIDCVFTMATMDDEDFCLPIRVGLKLRKCIMNKYYNLTDESEVYRVSIGMFKMFSVSLL